jgi:NTE family protein
LEIQYHPKELGCWEETLGYPFRNFVFEGGGVKGLADVGALQVFQQKGILPDIIRVGGTSAGTICALLVGLSYPIDKISSIFLNIDFKKFLDSSWGAFAIMTSSIT